MVYIIIYLIKNFQNMKNISVVYLQFFPDSILIDIPGTQALPISTKVQSTLTVTKGV
jgi:hypothetical protein